MRDRTTRALDKSLASSGLPADSALYAGEPSPSAPAPPDGPWLILKHRAQYLVGACSRGQFVPYDVCWGPENAIAQVIDLLTRPTPSAPLVHDRDECLRRGVLTAGRLLGRAEERDGEPAPAELQVGDLLDALEPETAHHLYPFGTPFAERSLPPPLAEAAYSAYEVVRAFEGEHPDVLEGVVAPWFEQPGGGGQVVLDRPIRFYADAGYLVRLDDPTLERGDQTRRCGEQPSG